jgi:hypothetical protein
MGYTHYWAFDPDAPNTDAGFARTAADAARIIAAAGIPVARDWDEPDTPPEVTAEVIACNGIGEDGHETFLLVRDPASWAGHWRFDNVAMRGYWDGFCKTNWKPYDLVACAILIRAHQHMPDAFVFNSDGDWEDESWLGARDLIARVFGAEAAPAQDPMRYTGDGPPSTTRRL